MGVIFKKELKSYFLGPLAYIYLGVFLFFVGLYFVFGNLFGMNTAFNSVLSEIVLIFLFISPVITMRILSEERKNKTDQLLYTSPQSIYSIVLGKFAAAFALFLVGVALTLIYPIILSTLGTVIVSELISSYLGLILIGGAFISIGMLISALTENQVTAAVATLGTLLIIWFMEPIAQSFPQDALSGLIFVIILVCLFGGIIYGITKNKVMSVLISIVGVFIAIGVFFVNKDVFYGIIGNFFSWFALIDKNIELNQGLVPLSSITYYLSFIFIMLLITVKSIEKRRWS